MAVRKEIFGQFFYILKLNFIAMEANRKAMSNTKHKHSKGYSIYINPNPLQRRRSKMELSNNNGIMSYFKIR